MIKRAPASHGRTGSFALATQSTLTGRLDELGSLDAASPAVIVIGAVAAFPAGLEALAGVVRQGGDLHR